MKSIKFLSCVLCVLILSLFCVNSWAGPRIPVLKMLSGEGCPACIQMEKVLEQIKRDYKGRINTEHIDLADRPDLVKKYNIRYIPTLVFIDSNGKDAAIEVGYRSLDEVLNIFKKVGEKI